MAGRGAGGAGDASKQQRTMPHPQCHRVVVWLLINTSASRSNILAPFLSPPLPSSLSLSPCFSLSFYKFGQMSVVSLPGIIRQSQRAVAAADKSRTCLGPVAYCSCLAADLPASLLASSCSNLLLHLHLPPPLLLLLLATCGRRNSCLGQH